MLLVRILLYSVDGGSGSRNRQRNPCNRIALVTLEVRLVPSGLHWDGKRSVFLFGGWIIITLTCTSWRGVDGF